MIDLFLWIPNDFDKRYKKYLSKFSNNKTPEPFLIDTLTKEKENLLLITDRSDYEFEIEKWRPLKIIVDAIYKELSPFEKESQIIKIDISKLDIPENIASSVLMMLTYERICKWKIDTNPIVITTENLRKYLKGDEVIVQNYENLCNFRKKISDFYNFMEQQKIQKFSEIKPLKIEKKLEKNKEEGLKLNLSFSPSDAVMFLTDQDGKEYKIKIQGQSQKEVLRVIFENSKTTYTDWSLYDISDILGSEDLSEKAVHDAIYQFNRKVQLKIPEIKNLFELTKHSTKINSKYINKT